MPVPYKNLTELINDDHLVTIQGFKGVILLNSLEVKHFFRIWFNCSVLTWID